MNAKEEFDPAAQAAEAENTAKKEPDPDSYTHSFKQPILHKGAAIEQLTFDWGSLTGADHLAIETEMLRHGKTLVTPAFTGDFLCGMAARACTLRDKDGFRVLSGELLQSLPIRDFQAICQSARAFLLRAGL